MKNRLILVEGIPGSGKSTIANKIKEYLETKGLKVKLFNEGDLHPADLAWQAYLTIDEYNQVVKENPELKDTLAKYTQIEGEYAVVAYTKLGIPMKSKGINDYLGSKEVYDGKVDLDTFKAHHLRRWKSFADNAADDDYVYIFECAYLQNHVSELMGCYCKDIGYINNYMFELIDTVKYLNPQLIYLTQADVRETIKRVTDERVSSDKSKWEDWIDLVIKYVENSKYAEVKKLKGYDGVITFFEDRKILEELIIDKLDIDKAVVENINYNWDRVLEEVVLQIDI